MKKQNLIYIVLAAALMIISGQLPDSSTASGLTMMGPPRSLLNKGQSAVSLEAAYSQMDLEAFGPITNTQSTLSTPDYTKFKIENLKSATISARLDTSVFENWDLFARIGTTNGKGELKEDASSATGHEFNDFDGTFGFSWGVGTRTSFYKDENISWGSTLQVNWANPGTCDITDDTDSKFTGEAEIKYWEFQIGIGPTFEIDKVRIYGGPFLHYINGDLDITGITQDTIPATSYDASLDIREKTQVGAFIGTQIYLGKNVTLIAEGQLTGDGWGIGINPMWKF